MIVSLPFLLVTFFIYGCIPELRNLHGKCLMCYIIGLLTFYIGIILVNLNKGNYVELFECKLIGYLILIGVQLCFFWLNVMCYDIWSAFKVGMKTHGSDRKRFLGYCLYAFGVPLMIISLIFLIDSTEFIPKDYRPEIGIFRCYIKSSKLVESIYVYIPISTILIVNIVLYSITALTIYRVKKETAVIRSGDNQRHAKVESDKDKFMLYLRLFIVMGASWIMESISVLFDQVEYIFYATDFLNCIQGVIIFILFVWTPKVKKILIKK
jgi:G protein-coupled receptor Mth (Methuselah protein)